ncbi:MAG TPA: alpha/beta hydrolase [Candidatus Saccharimonadales bacterium]|nr:alpha/beta hydrolase [Candidatus Saccharimonadales bacterium]
MKKDKFTVLNNKGQKLAVCIFKNKTDRVILGVPGIIPFDEIIGIEKAFKKYHSLGNSVCYFDTTGTGSSEGAKGINIEQVVEDIGSVLNVLAKKYKKIILYGPSLGAIPAIIGAVKYKNNNLVKLIHINGFFYPDKHLTSLQRLRIGYNFLLNPKLVQQKRYVKENFHPEMVKIPTLIVYGEKDRIVNPEQSKNMYRTLKTKKEILMILDGDHELLKEEYISHAKRLFEWLS